jgi:hypothetical protein
MTDWCPFVTRRDGPSWKVGYSFVGEAGPKRGEAKHSAEGYWAGLYSALDGPEFKSWQFTVGYNRTEQHYPFRAHCWHAGDVDDDGAVAANLDLVGIEHLGMAGEALSPYQIDMTTRITEWCAEQEGRDRFRRFDGWDPDEPGLWLLAEHKQVSDVYTACPSGRIPWDIIIPALEEEPDMPQPTVADILRVLALLNEAAEAARFEVPMKPETKAALHYLLHL